MAIDPSFVRWTTNVTKKRQYVVLPDGCRDIVISAEGAMLTDWDMRPRRITLMPGDRMVGYRLRPGLVFDTALLAELKTPADAEALIAVADDLEIATAIDLLAGDDTPLPDVARRFGVSLRGLQRHFRAHGQPRPVFWRMLGRARRSAIALGTDAPLVDVAGMHGYADQAHMTRALRHWFGATPAQVRADADLRAEIDQPALGTWTGEQISMR
ncbi:AraC family transcriptional regulator [Yoonia sp. 2307UL14-13]|uniref:AraC family transcriptional regulator n=1 Tax=Yoonia sp. 2307UL14-13 TaxID=3126506 RepID=UPI0030AEE83A